MASSSSLSPARPQSRPTSRQSIRAPSPSFDDPVAVRNQMSSLRHEIRQKQAQFNALESILLRGPRPLPPSSWSPTASEFPLPPSTIPAPKMQRRSSWDALSAYTVNGPESHIPLPVNGRNRNDDIREGVPLDFGTSGASLSPKRVESPTRSMSRIPVSSVGHARALADDGRAAESHPTAIDTSTINAESLTAPSTPHHDSMSPGSNRKSLTGGGNTTKVLADLQAGVMASRTALDNTKAQLRLSQRTVAQLTRQTEDLKDGRERLRLENEGLNNVVARKERLLQEVLERARKAEAEAQTYKSQLKQETTNAKKSIREMELTLAESTALSAKSEREYITLRDSMKHMVDGWKADVERLKEEIGQKEQAWKTEAEAMKRKYEALCKLVEEGRTDWTKIDRLKAEAAQVDKEFQADFREELKSLSIAIERSTGDAEEAKGTATLIATELARLRRLMRAAGRIDDNFS